MSYLIIAYLVFTFFYLNYKRKERKRKEYYKNLLKILDEKESIFNKESQIKD
jgi:hypothetical protein